MTKPKQKKNLSRLHKKWIKFGYKHTLLAALIVFITVLIIDTAIIAVILEWFQSQGYIGGFIGGIMLVSSFTVAPAIVLLLTIAENVHPLTLVIVASFGSMLGDWLLLRFIQDEIAVEMRPLMQKLRIRKFIRRLQQTWLRYLVTGFGALLIMLPLPDELGLSFMGIGHLKRWKIITICYFLNFVGLYALIIYAKQIKNVL